MGLELAECEKRIIIGKNNNINYVEIDDGGDNQHNGQSLAVLTGAFNSIVIGHMISLPRFN